MDARGLEALAVEFFAAWNSQDADRVLACYTDDCVYRDPNLSRPLQGKAAFRRYLTRLFRSWSMTWTLKELRPLAAGDGAAVLWSARLRPQGGPEAAADGMDLVLVREGRISRNEVYFDRTLLPVVARPGKNV